MIDCANSVAPGGEALLRPLLDEDPLSEEARIHLEQRQICQQGVADYRWTHSLLLFHLDRRQCPDGTQVSLYCASLLPMNERIRIATYLLACPPRAAEIALLAIMSSSDPTVGIETSGRVEADPSTVLRVGEEQSEHGSQRTHAESPEIRTYVDDTSNMVFRAVPPGNYDLVVRLPGYELVMKGVMITSG
jgi:hypothetical protein